MRTLVSLTSSSIVVLVGAHDAIAKAMVRHEGQKLYYFDDLISYKIVPRGRTATQRDYARVMDKMNERVELIDDLAHGRKKLPVLNAPLRNGHATKSKLSPFLTAARTKMTSEQRQRLDALLLVDRELLFELLMRCPETQMEWDAKLEQSGLWLRIATASTDKSKVVEKH